MQQPTSVPPTGLGIIPASAWSLVPEILSSEQTCPRASHLPRPFQAHQASQNIFVLSEQTGSLADLEAVVQGWLWLKNHQGALKCVSAQAHCVNSPSSGLTGAQAGTSCVAPALRGLFACYRDLGCLFQTQKGHQPQLVSNKENFPKAQF